MGGAFTGGVLGHAASSTSALERQQQREGFMGRKSIQLRDLPQRCVLARGAVTEQIGLDEVKCGEIALTLEWRESVAAFFVEPETGSSSASANVPH